MRCGSAHSLAPHKARLKSMVSTVPDGSDLPHVNCSHVARGAAEEDPPQEAGAARVLSAAAAFTGRAWRSYSEPPVYTPTCVLLASKFVSVKTFKRLADLEPHLQKERCGPARKSDANLFHLPAQRTGRGLDSCRVNTRRALSPWLNPVLCNTVGIAVALAQSSPSILPVPELVALDKHVPVRLSKR